MGLILAKDRDEYWLAIPNSGSFLLNCYNGNAELLGIVQRRPFCEIPLDVRTRMRARSRPSKLCVCWR